MKFDLKATIKLAAKLGLDVQLARLKVSGKARVYSTKPWTTAWSWPKQDVCWVHCILPCSLCFFSLPRRTAQRHEFFCVAIITVEKRECTTSNSHEKALSDFSAPFHFDVM